MPPIAVWKKQIIQFIKIPEMHYLWLKSLSYLEYIGYRKMIKSLPQPITSNPVFQHLSDEIRHSFVFQKLSEKLSESITVLPSFESPLIAVAETYFQGLDAKIEEWVVANFSSKQPEYCYMLTSYVIERRALEVYPFYHAQLEEGTAKSMVLQVIKDEREHLDSLETRFEKIPQLKKIKDAEIWALENILFNQYIEALTHYQLAHLPQLEKVS